MKVIVMRVIAIVLCVVIVFGLVALFLKRKGEEGSRDTTRVGNNNKSNIKADTIMIEMNESYSATADEYFYHALGLRNEYISQYGAEIFDYYPELVENILSEVDSIIIDNAAYSLWGSEVGFALTDEDYEEFEKQIDEMRAYLVENGSTFQKHLKENNLNEELFRTIYLKNIYVNKFLTDYVLVEMPNLEVNDEEIEECISKYSILAAKHILLTEELIDEDLLSEDPLENEAALQELAREILARIDEGEDFDELMHEYSQDPGLVTNPDGYTFRTGEFVESFEAVTRELEIGEISDIVESEHGIHIIQRIDIDIDTVIKWVQQEKMEQKRIDYEIRLDPKTTEARDSLILLDMKSVL